MPGAGWVGLDPTSGLMAGEGHLPLAATPSPDMAAPISGSVDKCEVDFSHQMSVARVADAPRVTKPYTEEQWAAVERLGHKVDARLNALDVRLTMGGEPTFVSIDDMQGDEWNTTADSPEKRRLAGLLLRRLAHCYGHGALLHFGQGKWYPGEQLPRWAFGCYWRKDGEPIWNNPELIAADDGDYRADPNAAQRFIQHLAERLEVRAEDIVPGYEDAWYYMWKERRLPANVDPLKSNLNDEAERKRLARIFERGLNEIVGYALPIRPVYSDATTTRWESGRWFLRQENMFLTPGDSPMGFRMPLDSLPWYAADDTTPWQERDPLAPREPLEHIPPPPRRGGKRRAVRRRVSPRQVLRQWRWPFARRLCYRAQTDGGSCAGAGGRLVRDASGTALRESAAAEIMLAEPTSQSIRTALCVEPRNGRMHVFMPPIARLEDYLRLVEAIEDTAEELGLPVMIEGYTPPGDYRLHHFKVTPDPGVIEVNLHPSENWQELVNNTTTLYDEARRSRLGTEKFMLDGRHCGTCGGNHIVLGGARPNDSPFLRRPDLLRSLVAFWNNRPSLSYLFSGLFVGPTSQAPRTDEARHESIYELETAFSQVPEAPDAAVARRSHFPQSADRSNGQHASRGVLHRQALLARFGKRPPGAGGVPQFRDAAARPHEPHAAVAGPGPGRPLLGSSVSPTACPLGHFAARSLHAAELRRAGFSGSPGRDAAMGLGPRAGMVRAALRVPLSAAGRSDLRRRKDRAAAGH